MQYRDHENNRQSRLQKKTKNQLDIQGKQSNRQTRQAAGHSDREGETKKDTHRQKHRRTQTEKEALTGSSINISRHSLIFYDSESTIAPVLKHVYNHSAQLAISAIKSHLQRRYINVELQSILGRTINKSEDDFNLFHDFRRENLRSVTAARVVMMYVSLSLRFFLSHERRYSTKSLEIRV